MAESTEEVVVGSWHVASTERRLFAYALDQFVVFFFYLPVLVHIGIPLLVGSSWAVDLRWVFLSVFLHFAYDVLFLYFLGATIGKKFVGLEVVSRAGGGLTLFQCVLRSVSDRLSLFFGNGLRALAFLRYDRTHVSDWIAETRVVQKETRVRWVRRRKFLGLVLFLVLGVGSFLEIYEMAKAIEVIEGMLVYSGPVEPS